MTTPSILPDMPLNQHAARELELLFGKKSIFDTPKPVGLLRLLTHLGSSPGDLVLDFFAGAGSLADAVMVLNMEGGLARRYILVQFPEPLDPNNIDQKMTVDFCDEIGRPRNVAEITKERIRRAAKSTDRTTPLCRRCGISRLQGRLFKHPGLELECIRHRKGLVRRGRPHRGRPQRRRHPYRIAAEARTRPVRPD
ncbi:hypothetical protein J8F10_07105 [Gemmata sp. G18]|uniref:site-specific DNA-methyltransferase (adenine-specific) n=1 Tax=Gemmata palustris TaxID=2822762 RepID=A0ABS5BMT6_9BACT|nr:DNA methyltransferase [Gemmata palustris]MBP3955049.1 hypothetical protein [Gemmata palustris]